MRRGRWFLGWLIAWGLAGSVLVLPSACGSAVGAAPGCDRPGVAPCFDAEAIQFHGVAVPQPSALLLLGGGLMGLAAWERRFMLRCCV
jgi:hypothetical protein